MRTHQGPDTAPIMYRLLRAIVRPLVVGLLRPVVEGLEHVPASGPAILCPNHLSAIDTVLVPVFVPRPVVYLAKSEYFTGPSRWLFDRLRVVPVAREGGSAARVSLDRGSDVLRKGALLALFPEGTRSPDGRLYRGKTGPVRLARRTGAPIIPVGLIGTRAVLPPHARVPRLGPVTVRFGPPLHVGVGAESDVGLRSDTNSLMQAIRSLTGQAYVDAYARPPGAGDAHDVPPDGNGRPADDDRFRGPDAEGPA